MFFYISVHVLITKGNKIVIGYQSPQNHGETNTAMCISQLCMYLYTSLKIGPGAKDLPVHNGKSPSVLLQMLVFKGTMSRDESGFLIQTGINLGLTNASSWAILHQCTYSSDLYTVNAKIFFYIARGLFFSYNLTQMAVQLHIE